MAGSLLSFSSHQRRFVSPEVCWHHIAPSSSVVIDLTDASPPPKRPRLSREDRYLGCWRLSYLVAQRQPQKASLILNWSFWRRPQRLTSPVHLVLVRQQAGPATQQHTESSSRKRWFMVVKENHQRPNCRRLGIQRHKQHKLHKPHKPHIPRLHGQNKHNPQRLHKHNLQKLHTRCKPQKALAPCNKGILRGAQRQRRKNHLLPTLNYNLCSRHRLRGVQWQRRKSKLLPPRN